MIVATGLYLFALLLITLFSDVVFGVNAQSLAYGPLALSLLVLIYLALVDGPPDFISRWWTSSPMTVVGLLFVAGIAASLPMARDVAMAVKDVLRWTFVFMVYAPVTRAICDESGRCRLCARAAAAFVVGFAALAIGDLLLGGGAAHATLGTSVVTHEGRLQSVYGNPGILAGMLIVGFPLTLSFALSDRARAGRLAWSVGTTVILGGMLLSGSRAALVAAAVAAAFIAIALRRWWLLALTGAVVGTVGLLLAAGTLDGPPALARFQEGLLGTGTGIRSLRRRMLIWSVALDLIAQRPLVGWGGSQLRHHQHSGFNRAHNAWLDAWLDGGLLAAVAMLVVAALVLRRAWGTAARRRANWLDPVHIAWVASSLAVMTGWTVRAGIGSRIDWLPVFMMFGAYWEQAPPADAENGAARSTQELDGALSCEKDFLPAERKSGRGGAVVDRSDQ